MPRRRNSGVSRIIIARISIGVPARLTFALTSIEPDLIMMIKFATTMEMPRP
jgi:hypothetical protein